MNRLTDVELKQKLMDLDRKMIDYNNHMQSRRLKSFMDRVKDLTKDG